MGVRQFLSEVVEVVRLQLPRDLRDFQVVGPVFSLVKFHYGDPKVHYEAWVQRRAGIVEVGLHFEGEPAGNTRCLDSLVKRHRDALASLGPDAEPERWTDEWTRIHVTLPLAALDEEMLFEVATRLAKMITILEPAVRKTLGDVARTSS
jgi:hypothetical protein